MKRNLVVIGCSALLAFGLSFGSFAGSSPDGDSDGVPDAYDNCTTTPNGPLAGTGSCNSQEDANLDGYGNPCDADLNNDGATGLDDIAALLLQLNQPGDGDMNCDGAVGLDDAATALGTLNQPPGPSGLSCAGSGTPCSAS